LGIPAGGIVAFVVGAAVMGGFFGGLKYAETESFCTSCHEMSTPAQELTQSVHYSNEFGLRAGCANCHVPPTFVAGLVRHIEAYKEVWGHVTGELSTPAKYEDHRLQQAQKVWAELKANDSAECRSCHTPAAMALAKQPTAAASAHATLATGGMTCIDCHKGVAHTLPEGSG
jgi:cytochrome c-type protein NapC